MPDVGEPDIETCALRGYSPVSRAFVAASGQHGDVGVALVVTPGADRVEYLVWCVHEADGWHDAGGGSANEQWELTDDDSDLGRLAGWGRVAPEMKSVRVEYAGHTTIAAVGPDRYFAWLLIAVPCPDSVLPVITPVK